MKRTKRRIVESSRDWHRFVYALNFGRLLLLLLALLLLLCSAVDDQLAYHDRY